MSLSQCILQASCGASHVPQGGKVVSCIVCTNGGAQATLRHCTLAWHSSSGGISNGQQASINSGDVTCTLASAFSRGRMELSRCVLKAAPGSMENVAYACSHGSMSMRQCTLLGHGIRVGGSGSRLEASHIHLRGPVANSASSGAAMSVLGAVVGSSSSTSSQSIGSGRSSASGGSSTSSSISEGSASSSARSRASGSGGISSARRSSCCGQAAYDLSHGFAVTVQGGGKATLSGSSICGYAGGVMVSHPSRPVLATFTLLGPLMKPRCASARSHKRAA